MTQMTVRPSTRTVICKNCKVARLVQKSPKPVGDLGERDQLTRRGFSSEGLGFWLGSGERMYQDSTHTNPLIN